MCANRTQETGEPVQFGRWLSRQRKARDFTQEDLAERLGCSLSAIQKMEAGDRRPSRQVAEILADYFAIPPEERPAFVEFARGQRDQASEPEYSRTVANRADSQPPSGLVERPTNPNNLPVQLTSFVGRDIELPRIRDLMLTTEVRLLTLTGPPGTGKTRLALQVATQLLRDFDAGVFFVNLAPISDPELVIPEIAQSLGLRGSGAGALFEAVACYAKDMPLLLVLDNFEQVVETVPSVVDLLMRVPSLKVLATSRVPLHVRGEKEYSVPPLHLPDPEHLPPIERLGRYEAVQLFSRRAQDADSDFELTVDNASAVAHICARLDGLPLAIELAAARTKLLTPQGLLSRLHSRLKLLTSGPRDLPARQQTLRSAIEWSYDLLSDEDKKLFRRLAVFQSGSTLGAIEAVCTLESDLQMDVLDGVQSLMDKSLLRREEGVGGEPRFVMLETIHEYALEKLEESGEGDATRRQHADFFTEFVTRAAPELGGGKQREWLDRIEQELANLRAAVEWSLAYGSAETAAWMAAGLDRFWFMRSRRSEGVAWLEKVLDARHLLSTRALASVLGAAGTIIGQEQGDYERANALLSESLSLCRQSGDQAGTALALSYLGLVAFAQSDLERAVAFWEESLALRRELGDRSGVAQSLTNFGKVISWKGDYARAEAVLEESVAVWEELGDDMGAATALGNLADNALRQGAHGRAEALTQQALLRYHKLGTMSHTMDGLHILARVWRAQGKMDQAIRLLAALQASYEANRLLLADAHWAAITYADRERILSALRAQVNDSFYTRLVAVGRAMSIDQAVAFALLDAGFGSDGGE